MISIRAHPSLLIVLAFFAAAAAAQTPESQALSGKEWIQQYQRMKDQTEFSPELVYAPRYAERECPPEYTQSRDLIEEFLSGQAPSNFYQEYGVELPDSLSKLSPLTTGTDGDACQYFNGLLEELINQQYRLCEDGIAWYVYDFSYYKNDDFFFVVRSGGTLKAEDPDRPGCFPGITSLRNSPPVGIYLRDGFYPAPIWN